MGLCKCSKRKVTNLFCFVHRVNVCEDCMIQEHTRCVVHSYLKWLEDSDYDDSCLLCARSIQQGQIIRLSCYDLFHEDCLKGYIGSAISNEHRCPKCKERILPPRHVVSPVADQLRCSLQVIDTPQHSYVDTSCPSIEELNLSTQTLLGPEEHTRVDSDEDKYRRRHWSRGVRRWFKGQQIQTVLDSHVYRLLFAVALVVIAVVTLIILFTRVGREVARRDSSLDWNFNPNLRTGN